MQKKEESQLLANHAFGAPLLHVMGYMYDRKAEPWLGNIVGEWFARKYHNAATLVSVVPHFRLTDSNHAALLGERCGRLDPPLQPCSCCTLSSGVYMCTLLTPRRV